MANAFLQLGSKRTNIKEFLKEASTQNSIKYKPEKGRSHVVYFPFMTDINGDTGLEEKSLIAMSGKVHEWNSNDGKYHSTICTKGKLITDENGKEIADGSCPFCDRVSDSWNVYRYRYDLEEETCGKSGEELKKHMEAVKLQFLKERKTSDPRDSIYVLVVLFKTDDRRNPMLDATNLPSYELKIMKLSAARVVKIQTQLENNGASLEGNEIVFTYTDTDDAMLLVSQSSISAVFPDNKITHKFPKVLERVNADVEKFDFDGIDKAFPEWTTMYVSQAKKIVGNMFNNWDKYIEEKEINPEAKYLEYNAKGKEVSKPSIEGNPQIGTGSSIAGMPVMGSVPQMGAMPQTGSMPQMGAMPQTGSVTQVGDSKEITMPGDGSADI